MWRSYSPVSFQSIQSSTCRASAGAGIAARCAGVLQSRVWRPIPPQHVRVVLSTCQAGLGPSGVGCMVGGGVVHWLATSRGGLLALPIATARSR